jgi:two-component system, OmpR family, response regulator CpxR
MESTRGETGTAEGANTRRLLVIDDDVELCELVAEFLAREGFSAEFAHDGERGLEAALAGEHQAIILDVMLPRLGGFEVLRRVRERKRTPILMLTARGDHVDRIVGLEMGADDYIPKPFDPRELVARLRAVLRRTEATPPEASAADPLTVDDLRLDPSAREAWRGRQRLDLTAVEFDLLATLMRSAGRVVSRDELSRAVLGRAFQAFDRSIDMHVSHLRRKLGDAPGGMLIKTVRSAGYLLARRAAGEPE